MGGYVCGDHGSARVVGYAYRGILLTYRVILKVLVFLLFLKSALDEDSPLIVSSWRCCFRFVLVSAFGPTSLGSGSVLIVAVYEDWRDS